MLAASSLIMSCVDYPDRLRHLIPREITASRTLAYRTEWGTCATAVFSLDSNFRTVLLNSEDVLHSLNTANASAYDRKDDLRWGAWLKTPIITDTYDISIVAGNLARSKECLRYTPQFDAKAEAFSYKSANAFYSLSNRDDIAILIPQDGTLILISN